MHYYKYNISDFNQSTRHLSRLDRSIYRDLIDIYYDTERPLTDDLKKLCRKVMAHSMDEKQSVGDVLNEFFFLADGAWHNKRCDEELAIIYEKSEKARASAEKRWAKQDKINANAMRTQCEGNATQDTLHKTQDTLPNKTYVCFDLFWNIYPRKIDKKKAQAKWKTLKVDDDLFLLITNHLNLAYIGTDKKFIPHPTTYLNGARWEDEITVGKSNGKPIFEQGRDYVSEALAELAEKKRLLSELDS